MRLSDLQKDLLERGRDMQHMGGFYTAHPSEHRSCEALRKRGLLKFWNGRRSHFWKAQFYDITNTGRIALTTAKPQGDQ